jgi:hypothetical protein
LYVCKRLISDDLRSLEFGEFSEIFERARSTEMANTLRQKSKDDDDEISVTTNCKVRRAE